MAQTAERQRVQFFLPADVHEGLRVVAFQRRTSQQKLVVQWLRDKLGAEAPVSTPPSTGATAATSQEATGQ